MDGLGITQQGRGPSAAASSGRIRHSYHQSIPKDTRCLVSLTKRGGSFIKRFIHRNKAYMSAAAMPPTTPAVVELVQKIRGDVCTELDRLKPRLDEGKCMTDGGPYQVLECPSCDGFMNKPICLPCGHSLCKSCIERPSDSTRTSLLCPSCGQSCSKIPLGFQNGRSPTFILQRVSEKWYPQLLECCTIRQEGNKLANEKKIAEAIGKYTAALETGVIDHRVLSNRCKVYLDNGDVHLALQDAELCCSIRPFWAKGHYRRGVVLEQLNKLHEAASSFILCSYLGNTDLPVLKKLHSIIAKILDTNQYTPDELALSMTVTSCKLMEGFVNIYHEEYSDPHPINDSLVDISDFECVLCTGLLYKPVTVPCGHSFCQTCLARNFDHSPFCPICRSPLSETFQQHTDNSGRIHVDIIEESLVRLCFPQEYKEKCSLLEQSLLKASRVGLHDDEALPIFVCTIAFPGIPCPLHIFEPRYRLMVRRCIESNSRRFGMCLPLDQQGSSYSDYGTVLFISALEFTPDGRSLVSTIGERRFKVLERSTSDGYAMARIQFMSDTPVEGEANIGRLRELQLTVFNHAMKWFNALPAFTQLMIIKNLCVPPPPIDSAPESCPNGPAWVWWFIHAVPTSIESKLAFLSSVSLTERLLMLQQVLPLPTTASTTN